MSARITSAVVQSCLRAAVLHLVESMGTGQAASELGCDPTTVRRNKSSGWDDADLSALIAYEMQERGRSEIVEGLHLLCYGATDEQVGEPVRLHSELVRELQESAAVDQAILSDLDRSTAIGRRAIRAAIAQRRAHEDEMLRDLDATDRGTR